MRTSSRNALALGARCFAARYPREVMNPPSVSCNVVQKVLDPELIAIRVNVGDHLVEGRPGSAAKNADAAFKISLTRRNSAFSRLNRLISAAASEVTPG